MLAYQEHIATLEVDELPPPLADILAELRERLTRVEPINGEGPVCASVRKMSIEEACECAAVVVRLYGALARYHDDAEALLPLHLNGNGSAKPVVPRFLVRPARLRPS